MTKQIEDEAMKGPIMTDLEEALLNARDDDTLLADLCREAATKIASLRRALDTERAAHEATKADSFDRGWNAAIEAAADVVCGYIHPDYGCLPGEAFASAQVRQLKKDTP